jgi:hypothetical protein
VMLSSDMCATFCLSPRVLLYAFLRNPSLVPTFRSSFRATFSGLEGIYSMSGLVVSKH